MTARTTTSLRRASMLGVSALTATMLLAGCGGDEETAAPATNTATASATSGSQTPVAGEKTVVVTETDFKLALSETTFAAGDYVFNYTNAGKAPHNLYIKGPGVNATSASVQPGAGGAVRVKLQSGEYELWCAVGSHRAQGMDTKITVS